MKRVLLKARVVVLIWSPEDVIRASPSERRPVRWFVSVHERDRGEQDCPRFPGGVCKRDNCRDNLVPRARYMRKGVRRKRLGSETRLTWSASPAWSPSCRRRRSIWGELGVLSL